GPAARAGARPPKGREEEKGNPARTLPEVGIPCATGTTLVASRACDDFHKLLAASGPAPEPEPPYADLSSQRQLARQDQHRRGGDRAGRPGLARPRDLPLPLRHAPGRDPRAAGGVQPRAS